MEEDLKAFSSSRLDTTHDRRSPPTEDRLSPIYHPATQRDQPKRDRAFHTLNIPQEITFATTTSHSPAAFCSNNSMTTAH